MFFSNKLLRLDNYLAYLSMGIILSYALRVTIPAVWIHPIAPTVLDYSGFVLLFLAILTLIARGEIRLQPLAIILLLSVSLSAVLSVEFEVSFERTILWVSVFVAVGPVISSPSAREFRAYLWQHSIYIIYVIVILSFFWNSLGLPIYGKGAAGVTVHCMLLGALAGISIVLSFHRLQERLFRSVPFWGVFIASTLTCLMSGSRSASLAAIAGCVIVWIGSLSNAVIRVIMVSLVLFLSLLAWTAFDLGEIEEISQSNATLGVLTPYTVELLHKGSTNTREELWANRLAEFEEYPFIGIGIGAEIYKKASAMGFSLKTIEPGSSYLAVLSMTGLIGGIALAALLVNLFNGIKSNKSSDSNSDVVQMMGVGAFFAVHAVAEGWVFAGGAILCLFFWIWVGRLMHFNYTLVERS